MEAIGAAVSVWATFKEVYLVSRFITRTLRSAKHAAAEQADLYADFRHEFLYFRSMGVFFLLPRKSFSVQGLDEAWLDDLELIFGRLRSICGEYAQLAAESDPMYMKFSPVAGTARTEEQSPELFIQELDDSDEEGVDTIVTQPSGTRVDSLVNKLKASDIADLARKTKGWTKATANDLKWALFQKSKVEDVIRRFHKQNKKLRDLASLALGVHARLRDLNADALAQVAQDPDARRVGLSNHALLRRLTLDLSADAETLVLNGMELDVSAPENDEEARVIVADLYVPGDSAYDEQTVLVEYKYAYDQATQSPFQEGGRRSSTFDVNTGEVQQLASLLSAAGNSDPRTLPFKGRIYEPQECRCAFVFDFPPGTHQTKPRSLNSIIGANSSSSRLSLPTRFVIAQKLARALGAFHADGWVHKSFRSDSIMFFRTEGSAENAVDFMKPYLTNFEFSRHESVQSMGSWEDRIENNVYRHPDRQGPPRFSFRKEHDVYSLGVVLLEIGTWQTAMSMYSEALAQQRGYKPNARGIRKIFLSVAAKKLSYYMGPAYHSAVEYCLSVGSAPRKTPELNENVTGTATGADTGGGQGASDSFEMEFRRNVVQRLDIKQLHT